jgi:ABC-type phosphate transport system substrate-binding protein
MKKIQRFCAAAVLMLVLGLSAAAGEISMPGATSPPPPQKSSATGDISIPGETATGEMSGPGVVALDPVTEAALNLFQSLLSLF